MRIRAVISTTYDDKYLFYLPIVIWCWNRLGVDVICAIPSAGMMNNKRWSVVEKTLIDLRFDNSIIYAFKCSEEKATTYAQCARLYAASLDLPEDDVLIVSDVDMVLFQIPPWNKYNITVFGADLTPPLQYPMCYIAGTVKVWRDVIGEGSCQQHIDRLLGGIDCENFRGNYWAKDQEEIYRLLRGKSHSLIPRARAGTQFASSRVDRDDAYFMDRLSPDIVDYHAHRPAYELDNFNKMLSVIKYFYPSENLDWMIKYHSDYVNAMQ